MHDRHYKRVLLLDETRPMFGWAIRQRGKSDLEKLAIPSVSNWNKSDCPSSDDLEQPRGSWQSMRGSLPMTMPWDQCGRLIWGKLIDGLRAMAQPVDRAT
jgi:hypothetical protein